MNARIIILLFAVAAVDVRFAAQGKERSFQLEVNAGGHARNQSPAKAILDLPNDFAEQVALTLTDSNGIPVAAQLTRASLLSSSENATPNTTRYEAHFIVPELAAGGVWKLTASVANAEKPALEGERKRDAFAWIDSKGASAELRYGSLPVLRYMYEALDESTPERRAETYKVYHHVFDPSGKTLLTKGPGGLYPHHRGLFYGFNRISYGAGRKADTWHCTNGAYLAHSEFVEQEAGFVLGRHRVSVAWHGQDKDAIAKEEREMSAYHLPNGTLVEFASRLQTQIGGVQLDGDPQHAGFQFRAAQEVADVTNKQTYYVRPGSTGAPGETLNWPEAAEMINLPWHAMSCVIGGERYTIAMLDRPQNPKESRFSERDYGRFGSYFEYDLDVGKPLELNYRVWVQAGETTAEEIAAKSQDFINPVTVTVTPR